MAKGRYKYFPVLQNPEKAKFNRSFVYVNKREWTDQNGIYHPAVCRSINPGANGLYVVDTEAEYAKEKENVLARAVESGLFPIIGPFNSVEDAVVAERKARPLTDKEKLAQANANIAELEALRQRNAELESKGGKKTKAEGENF
jgi:hypothetical protein